jgi:glycosyltransferase involved in cell wall biosynthesis
MKALFLRTDFYGHLSHGGSFSHTKGFLDGLRALGHTYAVMSSGSLPVDESMPFYRVQYSSLYRNLPEVLSVAYNYRVLQEGRRIIQKEKPEFIYHRHSEFNFASSILAREFGIPLVLEFNGSEVWVKKNWGRIYFEYLCRRAEQVQLEGANVITVVSQVIKDDLVRMGANKAKIVVNPNGVDPERFNPNVDGTVVRKKHGLQDCCVAGFVGTFGAWHGVEVLARSIKPTVLKNPKVKFLIIGDGNLRGEVERIIREDGVEQYAILTGSVPYSEIPQYLGACDILLSPHVQNQDGTVFFGSPTKLFEYMGMGKPIVASGVGQIGEILTDEVNALLMKHRDHADLADKILRLAADSGLRNRLGAAARADAVNRFSWKINAERVIESVKPFVRA